MQESRQWDAVVLGAGVAGLAAARSLAWAGLEVLVLEARERVGGRIHTLHPEGAAAPVELGAEFIHGRPPELLALVAEAGLTTHDVTGRQFCREDNAVAPCGENDGEDGGFALIERLREEKDESFDEFLARVEAPPAAKREARLYVEGFNAADASRIGTAGLARQQAAEDSIEGDTAARIAGGYGALVDYLRSEVVRAGGEIRLGWPAARVSWQPGRVSVASTTGASVWARRAVSTLPLGVLQAGSVSFDPAPPSFRALGTLAMGLVQRLVLVFAERFWAPEMSFLFAREQTPGVWWTSSPIDSNVLVGWIGGPRALAVGSAESLLAAAFSTLEQMYGLTALRSRVRSWHLHDWQADPYSAGAYSYLLVGGLHSPAALAEPVEDTLFFAGEHTDVTGHPGTVHGALRSGLRASAQVLGTPVAPRAADHIL